MKEKLRNILIIFCVVLISGCQNPSRSSPIAINDFNLEVKKTDADGAASDYFGWSVSLSGNCAITGVMYDDDNGVDSGSAYVFYKDQGGLNNWGQITKLTASDGAANDYFGYSVSMSGDFVIVGAYGDDDNGVDSGSAYVFYKDQGGLNNWGQITKLTASDGAANDYFGYSVSMSGDFVIVGAYRDDDNGLSSGSAYVFYKDQGGLNNWGQITKLTASDATAGDSFGFSVSVSGDYAITGVMYDDDNGVDSGSAYVFYKDQGGLNNWGQVIKLRAPDGAADDNFGFSVSISGDYAIVSAYKDDDNGDNSGSAYVFYKDQGGLNNWGQVTKLKVFDGEASDYFGWCVNISGDYAIVGSKGDDVFSGSAYIFYRNLGGPDNWGEQTKLLASDRTATDYFGRSVSISDDYAIIGAHGDDNYGNSSGAVYFYY